MKKIFILSIIIITSLNIGVKASEKGDAGTYGNMFLNLSVGARPVAMGSSYVSLSDDAFAMFYNPAGLSQMNRPEGAFQHNSYFQEIYQEYGVYTHPLLNGQAGVSVDYLGYGAIKKTTILDPQGLTTGNYNAYDIAMQFSYAEFITKSLSVGGSAKFTYGRIDENTAFSTVGDIGVLYISPISGLKFGLVIQNIGSKVNFLNTYEEQPLQLRTGVSFKRELLDIPITTTMDLIKSRRDDWSIAFGTEIWLHRMVAFRTGYNSRIDADAGYSLGIGIKFNNIDVDYAYVPFGKLGDSHRISGIYRFGYSSREKKESIEHSPKIKKTVKRREISSPIQKAKEKSPAKNSRVKEYYKNGFSAFIAEDYKKAIIELEKAHKISPNSVDINLPLGYSYLNIGRNNEAKKLFEEVLEVEPGNKLANEGISIIKK